MQRSFSQRRRLSEGGSGSGEGSNSEKQFSVRDCPFSLFPKHGTGHAVVEDSMDVVENRREFESQWSCGALRVATKAQNKS